MDDISDDSDPKHIGELIMKFKNSKDGEASVYSGTGFLYKQVSPQIFLLMTAASNFVKLEKQGG